MTVSLQQHIGSYQAARSTVACYRIPNPGFLRIGGDYQLGFIQRQTTNDIYSLVPGQTLPTVLTSPTARILDVWQLLAQRDSIGVITLPGYAATTARFLRSHVFFTNKVFIEDHSDSVALFELIGPQIAAPLTALGFTRAPEPGQVLTGTFDQTPLQAIGLPAPRGSRVWLLAPARASSSLAGYLDADTFTPEEYEVLRVEDGLPAAGHELTEDYSPLEMNLDAAIAARKGAYVGQEVIARQIIYDKITRRLAGLRLPGDFDPAVVNGAALEVEKRHIGTITSAVKSPSLGLIGLAVIRRPYHQPGTAVRVRLANGTELPGTVAALPF